MSSLPRRIIDRVANSYKVQNLLFHVGIRKQPPGVLPLQSPLLYREWECLVPSRELWPNPKDQFVHYMRWPFEYRAYLTLLCRMQRDASVLELGCNHGRTMLALTNYLQPPAKYEGLDIRPAEIEFAQTNIHTAHPLFN